MLQIRVNDVVVPYTVATHRVMGEPLFCAVIATTLKTGDTVLLDGSEGDLWIRYPGATGTDRFLHMTSTSVYLRNVVEEIPG